MNILSAIAARQRSLQSRLKSGRVFTLPALRNYAFKIGENKVGLTDSATETLATDENEMSAVQVISTLDQDRDGDIVLPESVKARLQNYKRNPVVFFAHQQLPIPIGLSETPKGECTVSVEPTRIVAKCFFSQKTPEGQQFFHLVNSKLLRMASIGFMPIIGKRLGGEGDGTELWKPGWEFSEIDLMEWSYVGVPSNPMAESIRGLLSGGKIAGEAISAAVYKSLEPFAATIRAWSPGANLLEYRYVDMAWSKVPTKETNMSCSCNGKTKKRFVRKQDEPAADIQAIMVSSEQFATVEEAAAWITEAGFIADNVQEVEGGWLFTQFPAEQCQDGASSEEPLGDGVSAVVCETKPAEEVASKQDPEDEEEEEDEELEGKQDDEEPAAEEPTEEKPEEKDLTKAPLGAQCLAQAIQLAASKAPLIEQPDVKEFFDALLSEATSLAESLYPDFDLMVVPSAEEPIEPMEEPGNEVMGKGRRRFIGRKQSSEIEDVATDLEEIAGDEDVKRAYRKTLVHDAGVLRGMLSSGDDKPEDEAPMKAEWTNGQLLAMSNRLAKLDSKGLETKLYELTGKR